MSRAPSVQCRARVYRRDTYRYTGRAKGGFELHYEGGQCKRMTQEPNGLCHQHQHERPYYDDRGFRLPGAY